MSIRLIMYWIEQSVYYEPSLKLILLGLFIIYSLVVWALLCWAVAVAANRYGRLAIVYFLLSIIFSPLVGAAFLFARGPGRWYTPPTYSVPAASVSPDAPPQPPVGHHRPFGFDGV